MKIAEEKKLVSSKLVSRVYFLFFTSLFYIIFNGEASLEYRYGIEVQVVIHLETSSPRNIADFCTPNKTASETTKVLVSSNMKTTRMILMMIIILSLHTTCIFLQKPLSYTFPTTRARERTHSRKT